MIAAAILLVAVQSSGELAKCEGLSPNAAVTDCYERAAAEIRARVDETFARVLGSAQRSDADIRKFEQAKHLRVATPSAFVGFLKASQSAWTAYSDKQCALEGETSRGGSGTDSLKAQCHYRLDIARLAELQTSLKLIEK